MSRIKRFRKQIYVLGTLVLLVLLSMMLILAACVPADNGGNGPGQEEPEEIGITIDIDYADILEVESHNLTMLTGDTAWDALKEVAVVEATWYPAFGSYFIKGINDVGTGTNTTLPDHWWMFYVNNATSPVGASHYTLEVGDSLLFKYEESEW